MRLILTAAAVSLATLNTGCKKEPSAAEIDGSNGGEVRTTINDTATLSAPLGSADFANAIAGGGRFEIESAALAAKNASSADVKSLAAMISSDHQKAGEDLKAAAESSNPPFNPLASLNAKQKADLAALQGLKGGEFDRVYVTQQIAAHRAAVGQLKSYAGGGTSPQLKNFASKVLPTVQSHLDRLETLPK